MTTTDPRIVAALLAHAPRGVSENHRDGTCTFRCECGAVGPENAPLPWPSPAHAAHQAAAVLDALDYLHAPASRIKAEALVLTCPCGHKWRQHSKQDGCHHGWGDDDPEEDQCDCYLAHVHQSSETLA